MFPLKVCGEVNHEESRCYPTHDCSLHVAFVVLTQYLATSDGPTVTQTDRRTIRRSDGQVYHSALHIKLC